MYQALRGIGLSSTSLAAARHATRRRAAAIPALRLFRAGCSSRPRGSRPRTCRRRRSCHPPRRLDWKDSSRRLLQKATPSRPRVSMPMRWRFRASAAAQALATKSASPRLKTTISARAAMAAARSGERRAHRPLPPKRPWRPAAPDESVSRVASVGPTVRQTHPAAASRSRCRSSRSDRRRRARDRRGNGSARPADRRGCKSAFVRAARRFRPFERRALQAFAIARAVGVVADPADGRRVARSARDKSRRDIGGRAAEPRPLDGAGENRRGRVRPRRRSSRTA